VTAVGTLATRGHPQPADQVQPEAFDRWLQGGQGPELRLLGTSLSAIEPGELRSTTQTNKRQTTWLPVRRMNPRATK